MSTQHIELQLFHRPIPANHMECDACFGLIWADDVPCDKCGDRGIISCKSEDGDAGCECAKCKAESASMYAEYQSECIRGPFGCRDCGDICRCYRGAQS